MIILRMIFGAAAIMAWAAGTMMLFSIGFEMFHGRDVVDKLFGLTVFMGGIMFLFGPLAGLMGEKK